MPNPTVETLDLPHERHCGAQRPEVRCGPGVDVSLSSEATRSALDLYLLRIPLISEGQGNGKGMDTDDKFNIWERVTYSRSGCYQKIYAFTIGET